MIIKSSEKGFSAETILNNEGEIHVLRREFFNYVNFDIVGDYNDIYHRTSSSSYNSLGLYVSNSIFNFLKNADFDIIGIDKVNSIFFISRENINDFINISFFNKFEFPTNSLSLLRDICNNDEFENSLDSIPLTFLFKNKNDYSKMKMVSNENN